MNNKKKEIIINGTILALIIICFLVINIQIDKGYKRHLVITSDGSQYCYGIDYMEEKNNVINLKGWFLELKSVQNVAQNVSDDNAEIMLAFIPLNEDKVGSELKNGCFLTVQTMKSYRPEIEKYMSCEYDYSMCGFIATIDIDDLDLDTSDYRLVIKPNAEENLAIQTSVFLSHNELMYTSPKESPNLNIAGTDLEWVDKAGVRLVSRPDIGCYVYQLGNKLYWIADEGFAFDEGGRTYIEYMLDTTQVDRLPNERLENNWYWSNIGGCFEDYEITDQINAGKYRVMVREIPEEYSVTYIITGYYRDGWIWKSCFRPNYAMLLNK